MANYKLLVDQVGDTTATLISDTTPLPTSGTAYNASSTKTRPADTTAYAALDVIAESTSAPTVWTFANIGPSGGKIMLTKASLEIDIAAVPSGMGIFRLHLYDASPTAINDNAAYDLPSGDRSKYLGYFDIGTPADLGATLWAQNVTDRFQAKLASGSTTLYGILQTISGYTPSASDVFVIKLDAARIE